MIKAGGDNRFRIGLPILKYLSKDKKEAIALLDKVQKTEPKNSKLAEYAKELKNKYIKTKK